MPWSRLLITWRSNSDGYNLTAAAAAPLQKQHWKPSSTHIAARETCACARGDADPSHPSSSERLTCSLQSICILPLCFCSSWIAGGEKVTAAVFVSCQPQTERRPSVALLLLLFLLPPPLRELSIPATQVTAAPPPSSSSPRGRGCAHPVPGLQAVSRC